MDNLPSWPHASEVYSRAYCILENMARDGHVKPPIFKKKISRKSYDPIGQSMTLVRQGSCSQEMQDFINALNNGNEEEIKWHILENISYLKEKL